MDNYTLGNRMKGYEKHYDLVIPQEQFVMLRLDGNSFHNLTRANFDVPFDEKFKDSMHDAAIATLDYCQGKIAYVQSDEMSILLDDRGKGNELLSNRVQKICSLASSTCAVRFSKVASDLLGKDINAAFDCRCFTIPREELVNYFIWRQTDALKNAVNSIYYWKARETLGKKAAARKAEGVQTVMKEKILHEEYGIAIDQYPRHYIRGTLIYKRTKVSPIEEVASPEIIEKFNKRGQMVTRHHWFVDKEIDLFTKSPLIQSLIENSPEKVKVI